MTVPIWWARKHAPRATTNIATAVSVALAASTVSRRGQAVKVVRMVPAAYSRVIIRTPKLAPTIRLNPAPVRLPPRTVSSGCRLLVAPTNTAMPRMPPAMAARVHVADRRLRSLVHSECNAWVNPACWFLVAGGAGVAGAAAVSDWLARCGLGMVSPPLKWWWPGGRRADGWPGGRAAPGRPGLPAASAAVPAGGSAPGWRPGSYAR